MKSVLISIQPKWCELIASGKKTVEVRKTKPKLETPFKVYIYCTQGKEQKELFKLLYMRDRSDETDNPQLKLDRSMHSLVQGNTGLAEEGAQLFHLEMWAYVHGIASMLATGFLELDKQLISKMLTDCYQGLKKQYGV